jgi:hypothetical protein
MKSPLNSIASSSICKYLGPPAGPGPGLTESGWTGPGWQWHCCMAALPGGCGHGGLATGRATRGPTVNNEDSESVIRPAGGVLQGDSGCPPCLHGAGLTRKAEADSEAQAGSRPPAVRGPSAGDSPVKSDDGRTQASSVTTCWPGPGSHWKSRSQYIPSLRIMTVLGHPCPGSHGPADAGTVLQWFIVPVTRHWP